MSKLGARITNHYRSLKEKTARERKRKWRKEQLRDRDKEPDEKVLNKHDEIEGTTIVKKEEFHFGIFYQRGYSLVFDYEHNRSCLYKTREEAEERLNYLTNEKGMVRIEIREILEW